MSVVAFPYQGQTFESVDDVQDFYFTYVERIDFSVRKGSTLTINDEFRKRFFCVMQGRYH